MHRANGTIVSLEIQFFLSAGAVPVLVEQLTAAPREKVGGATLINRERTRTLSHYLTVGIASLSLPFLEGYHNLSCLFVDHV